jgi:hypothetical protein
MVTLTTAEARVYRHADLLGVWSGTDAAAPPERRLRISRVAAVIDVALHVLWRVLQMFLRRRTKAHATSRNLRPHRDIARHR